MSKKHRKQARQNGAADKQRTNGQRIESGLVVATQRTYVVVAGDRDRRRLVSAMTTDDDPSVTYTDELMRARRFRTEGAVLRFIAGHDLVRPKTVAIEMRLSAPVDDLVEKSRRPSDHGAKTTTAVKAAEGTDAEQAPEKTNPSEAADAPQSEALAPEEPATETEPENGPVDASDVTDPETAVPTVPEATIIEL